MIKFLFWFIRLVCLTGFIMSMTLVNIFDIWSGLFTILGLFAAFNVYVVGLIAREHNRGLPSIWILFRFFQFAIWFLSEDIMWQHLAIYIGWDIFVMTLYIIDKRYTFIEKETDRSQAKTSIRRY